jgi:uncharacterized damage-inducible protein DinB
MSEVGMLRRLFRYQAWANQDLLAALGALDPERLAEQRQTAIRVVNHCNMVNRIWAGHIAGKPHGLDATNTPETPTLDALRPALTASDRWYLDYLATATPEALGEELSFAFTDGDRGRMTREDMLLHVVTHNGFHRGEVGRILRQIPPEAAPGFKPPRDIYAAHLHRLEPERREPVAA